jgi:hypothetical protein
MGNYFSFVNPNVNNVKLNNHNIVNNKEKYNKFKKYNEPLKYNVTIIKPFTPNLPTIYE